MKIRSLLFALLFITISTVTQAQMKIGYVNIELVSVYMPEMKTMNQQLQTFQKKLGEKLQIKQEYMQSKYQEYQEIIQINPSPDEATKQSMEQEIMKLEQEIQKEAAEAEQKLMEKRQEMMEPILQKLNGSLKSLADEEGYDYILNSIDGNGVSIVLHGPEEHNLTQKLMKKLGIEIPSND